MGLEHTALRNPLAFRVDDVAAARATLEGLGVTFSAETLDTGVCHMAFFEDPDGNSLMLHRRYAPRVTESSASASPAWPLAPGRPSGDSFGPSTADAATKTSRRATDVGGSGRLGCWWA